MLSDLRYSLRLLAKTPGFTTAAVAILAVGIGLNTAMFSVIHALVFSARPYAEPDRICQLYTQDTKNPSSYRAFSYAAYREIRRRDDIFAGVLAHNLTMVGIGEDGGSRRAFSAIVSANYFDVLGRPPAQGRSFTAEEAKPGANIPVVVASHGYWKRTGSRPDLVGSTIRVNERLYTVVGIAPEGFTGTMVLFSPDLFFPLGVFESLDNDFQAVESAGRHTLDRPDAYSLFLVARLRPGVTPETAGAALAGIATGMAELFPAEHRDKTFTLGPLPRLGTNTAPNDERGLHVLGVVLLGMTGAVLLVVCFNLAGLLLARGHARRKEFAIRLALGGGRGRILRQLLTEGFVLSLAGGGLGFLLAAWPADLVVGTFASRLPITLSFPGVASSAVLWATLAFCIVATLGFSVGPALRLSDGSVLDDLKQQAGEDVSPTRRRWLPRHPLVVAQIAISLALLISAGLFIRIASRVVNTDTGFDADNTVVAEVDSSLGGYDRTRALAAYRAASQRLAALPGVASASIGALIPHGLINISRPVRRAGVTVAPDAKPATAAEGLAFQARWNSIGADYFATMGVPLRQGRTFTAAETEDPGAPAVAIVDETLARKLWPDGDALGRRIQFVERDEPRAAGEADDGAAQDPAARRAGLPTMEIVGIVASTRADFFEENPFAAIYVPFAQGFVSNVHFHVRPVAGGAGVATLVDAVRKELRAAAPGVPIFKVRTFRQHLDNSVELWMVRTGVTLFSVSGGLAVLIAVVGIYGIKAYAVSRRTREIGIRLALGAEPGQIRSMILREGLSMTLAGIGLGLLLGLGAGRLQAAAFPDVRTFDPLAFGCAAVALFGAALLACWLPARRATRVDPLVALRTE